VPRPRSASDEAILAATGRAIARYGLPHLTLAVVAAEAGLSPATLVQRFGSKRGLLLAFASRAEEGVRRVFARARAAHDSPVAALRAAVGGLARVRDRAELANNLTFLHMDLTDPDFHAHAHRHAEVVRDEIASLLGRARSASELAGHVDVDRLARAVFVTYQGSLVTWALTGDGALAPAVQADLDTLLTPYLKEDA
jgi:AcrR family transcriptional regulator